MRRLDTLTSLGVPGEVEYRCTVCGGFLFGAVPALTGVTIRMKCKRCSKWRRITA
jgi:hypothetical protein